MKLADRMRQSIRRRSGHVVLRAELAPLGSASQVSEALKTLQRDGELLRLGAGVYAKARRDESTHEVTPVVDVETLGREVALKLKAHVTDGAEGTLVLDTGDRRVSRKLALGQSAVQYVNNRNRRAFTAFRRKPRDTATFPTTDVGNYVRWLAGFHGVRYGHPFLDGNGRTMLVVHTELCHRAGFCIEWHRMSRSNYLAALSAEIATPGKGILDAYLLPFVGESQERQAWGGMIGGLPGLDGKGADDTVAGNYQDAEVSEQYREFERRRGYRIKPAADDGAGSA